MVPPFIWHRPGPSLRGVFSEAYVARPISEAAVEAHLAPMRRPDIDGAVRPLTRGMVLPEGHAHDARGLPPAGGSRCRPSSYSVAATAPGPRSSCGASAPIRSGRRSRRIRLRRRRSALHHRRHAPAAVADLTPPTGQAFWSEARCRSLSILANGLARNHLGKLLVSADGPVNVSRPSRTTLE